MNKRTVIFLISLGTCIENYDFVIYGLLASYLGKTFFPTTNLIASMIAGFSVFAVGYAIRPIGGIISGNLGDRFGRKIIFIISLLMMAFTTFAIGILPSYQHIGVTATVLLLCLRMLQGLTFSAEIPGSITFISEYASKDQQGKSIGLALVGVTMGAAIASLLVFSLNRTLTQTQMADYGWRIPFCLGGILAILSYFMRRKLQETPLFLEYIKTKCPSKYPVWELIKKYPRRVFYGCGISLFTACFIVFGVGISPFLQQFYHYNSSDIYFYMTSAWLFSAILLPFVGKLTDRYNRHKLILGMTSLLIITVYFFFSLLQFNNGLLMGLFILIYQLIVIFLECCYLAILVEIFPTAVRYSGVAVCLNFAFAMASATPFVITKIALHYGTNYVYLLFVLLASSTVLTVLLKSQKRQESLLVD